MAGTTISDIINPTLFTNYTVNRTMELSALIQSGIIATSPMFDSLASEAAQVHTMPFFEDLTGDSENIVESADLTAKGIKSNKDASTTIRRAAMWSATDLSAQLAGTDPMKAIGDLVAGFWVRDMQKEFLNMLGGVFASTDMARDHVMDISTKSDNIAKFSAPAFLDACQLLGDASNSLTGIIMHSATWTALKKQNLIETIRPSESAAFDTYQGRRVIIDDGCPVEDSSGKVYTTYIFGAGAVAYGVGNPVGFVATELDREKKKGSGVDYLINRKCFILHPRGISWTNHTRANTESVSREELANKDNWKRVYEPKQIRMVQFKHKL